MIIKSVQDKSVAGEQKQGSALVRRMLGVAVLGVVAISSAQAAGQRSAESMQAANQRAVDNLGTRAFEQDAHATNMARLRAETSAENKRKNAAAKAAADEAAAAKAAAAQQAAAAQAATPAVPAVPAVPASKE